MRTVIDAPAPVAAAPQTTKAKPSTSRQRKPARRDDDGWIQVDRITMELTENAVRLRFPSKPTEVQRFHLKQAGFWWHGKKGFWYNRRTPETQAFAADLEENGFPVEYQEPEPDVSI